MGVRAWGQKWAARAEDDRRLRPYERPLPFRQRAEGFFGGNGRDQLVDVAARFALFRLFYLEEIGWMDLASVDADAALAESVVVGRRRLHGLDHRTARGLGLFDPQRFGAFEIMQRRGIVARLAHVGKYALAEIRRDASHE